MKVITGKVRGSYVNVFKPRLNEMNGQEEYGMTLLIPKTDAMTVKSINDAIADASKKKWNGKTPPILRLPLRDGDAEKGNDANYAGMYFMNVKAKQRPGVVDKNLQQVMDSSEFMSGDYCRVSINAFAYEQKGNKGVSFGLNNIQVLEKGVPLGNWTRPEEDFAEDFG